MACSPSKAPVKAKTHHEIPIETLLSRGIVPYNAQYKSRYYDLLPYLFYNAGDDFIEIKGDYYSLKHPIHNQVNIMVGFWADYGKYKNVLLAYVWVNSPNQTAADTSSVQVSSSKHGLLLTTPWKKSPYRTGFRKELFFTKQIELAYKAEIIDKLYDDVITVTVDGHKYQLLNPEFKLD